jgi:DNA-binding MarR family transcriptional regulator
MYSQAGMRPGDGPAPSTGYLVWHLSTRWRVALDRALAPLGLTASRYAVLASLYGLTRAGAQPSQRELADFSGFEPMYVSKIIRALEREGLVQRAANPADPRAVQLEVTEEGAQRIAAGRGVVLELEEQRLAPLGGRASKRSAEFAQTLQELLRHAAGLEGASRPPAIESQATPPAASLSRRTRARR